MYSVLKFLQSLPSASKPMALPNITSTTRCNHTDAAAESLQLSAKMFRVRKRRAKLRPLNARMIQSRPQSETSGTPIIAGLARYLQLSSPLWMTASISTLCSKDLVALEYPKFRKGAIGPPICSRELSRPFKISTRMAQRLSCQSAITAAPRSRSSRRRNMTIRKAP